jgi:hypothetical protein
VYRKYVSIILLARRPSCTSRCAVWWIVVSMWIELRRRRLLVDQWIECCRSMDRMSRSMDLVDQWIECRRSNGSNVVDRWIECDLSRSMDLVDQWIECRRSMDRMSSIDGSNGALGDLRRSMDLIVDQWIEWRLGRLA